MNDIAVGGGDLVAQDLCGVQLFDSTLPYGGRIDWSQSASQLAAFVRAMDLGRGDGNGAYEHLSPPAKAIVNGRQIGIWQARAGGTMSAFPPGTITRCDREVWVQTGQGHLAIDRLCDTAGKDFEALEYLNAQGISPGESFDTLHSWKLERLSQLGFAA